MTKQADALANLESGGITERAEAVRQLGRIGDAAVLDVLVRLSLEDKSPGVRLAAASAAADVLARYRLEHRRDGIDAGRRTALIRHLRGIDPRRNTGLFQVLACAGEAAVVRNIARGVKDPRVDVRTGALVGLERLAGSGTVNGAPIVARTLGELLKERRLRSDALLGVARVAHRTGLWSLRPLVEDLAGRLEERWLVQLDELLAEFPERLGSEHLLGCWVDRGLDCGEQRAVRGAEQTLIVLPSTLLLELDHGLVPWTLEPDGLASDAFMLAGPQPTRVLRGWYDNQENVDLLQLGQRSFGRLSEKELPECIDALSLASFDLQPVARQLLTLIEPGLSERPAASYVRGVLALLAGDAPRAREKLEALAGSKRPRAEVHWHFACLERDHGSKRRAKAQLKRYLAAAKPKSPFRAAAEAW